MTEVPTFRGPKVVITPRRPCGACQKRGKTWEGSDPTCSFPNGGEFSPEGWNCATANMIRDLLPRWEKPESDRISGPHWNEDQYWATIDLRGIELERGNALTLFVSWYKSRRRTEAMWPLDETSKPWLPDEDDAIRIANAIATETRRADTPKSESVGR